MRSRIHIIILTFCALIGLGSYGQSQTLESLPKPVSLRFGLGISGYNDQGTYTITGRNGYYAPITTDKYLMRFLTIGLRSGMDIVYKLDHRNHIGFSIYGSVYVDEVVYLGLEFAGHINPQFFYERMISNTFAVQFRSGVSTLQKESFL